MIRIYKITDIIKWRGAAARCRAMTCTGRRRWNATPDGPRESTP